MVFGFGMPKHPEVTAEELDAMLRAGSAVVVDVREVDEFAAGHIPGAINMPLSTFQPSKLPDHPGKKMVLVAACGSFFQSTVPSSVAWPLFTGDTILSGAAVIQPWTDPAVVGTVGV